MLNFHTPPRSAAICRILALFALIIPPAAARASVSRPALTPHAVQGALQHLPLSFEANRGQEAATRVDFIARAAGFGLELTAAEADFALMRGRQTANIRMRIGGGNPKAAVSGQKVLPGRNSYFIGKDPKRWHSNIPTYQAVKYTGVYKGIDLVYYGGRQRLEYDFVVAPRANPRQISLSFGGAGAPRVEKNGDLTLAIAGGPLQWRRPVAYQESGGRRSPVSAVYLALPNGRVGFKLGRYDKSRSLTIDPSLIYSTLLSGPGYTINSPDGIAVDSAGEAFIFGRSGMDKGPEAANEPTDAYGKDRLFVAKLNATGSALLYLVYFGSNGEMRSAGIAVDAAGNAYLSGQTTATDFPMTRSGYRTTGGTAGGDLDSTSADLFLTKLDPSGSQILYSTYYGGSSWEREVSGSIAVDKAGNAYITGRTLSPDLPVVRGFQTTANEGIEAFLAKFDTTKAGADSLVYSTYIGGQGADNGWGVAVDDSGNAYACGDTTSPDFPVTRGAAQSTLGGASDAYVVKINTNAQGPSSLVYASYLGGSGQEVCFAEAVDSEGCAYLAGGTESSDFPVTAGALQQSYGGTESNAGYLINGDAFVVKLSADGASRVYSTYLGGAGADHAIGIVVDGVGHAYVSGTTQSATFPVRGGIQTHLNGHAAMFIDKLSLDGNALCYGTFLGGSGMGEMGGYSALDAAGRVYVSGYSLSHDFPLTPGALSMTSYTSLNGFAAVVPTTFAGDFDHDGASDLVLQDQTSGEISVWHMTGATVAKIDKVTPNPPSGWAVAGVGDFDGDPDPDIVLQNASSHQIQVWHMHGTALAVSTNVAAALPEGSTIVAVGDFNGDSRPDLVLQNPATGAAEIWFLKDALVTGTATVSPVPPAGSRIAGAGYFDSDGLSDLIVENAATHQVAIWLVQGAAVVGGGFVQQALPDAWHVVSTADTDGGGWPKIVLQNSATGQVALWTLSGAAVSNTATVSVKPLPGLRVVAP